MIRDRLRRLAHDALRRIEEERDSSRMRIYTAPWVVPGHGAPILDGAVALDREGRVLDVGPTDELVARFRWAPRADLDGILMPGLIDAHAQLELRGMTDGLPRGLGLRRRIRALREVRRATDALDPTSREAQLRQAVRSCVDAGTASVGDVTASLRAVPAMSREGLYGVVFHEIVGFSPRRAAKAVAAAAVQRAGIAPWPDGIRYRLSPHSLYSTAGSVVRELCARAIDAGAVSAIRLAEAEEEWELMATGSAAARSLVDAVEDWWDDYSPPGTDPLSYMEELGALHERVMLVHMTTATPEMAHRVSVANAPLVLCPRAEQQVSGRLPPLVAFLEEGCRVALGTDSLGAGAGHSVLREAAELHAAFPEVPTMVLIAAATAGGADALGLESMGQLAPGRAPGLLHVDTVGHVPEDPCGWMLRAGNPDLSWLARPAPPSTIAA